MSHFYLFSTNFSASSNQLLSVFLRHLPAENLLLFHLTPTLDTLPHAWQKLHHLAQSHGIPLKNCVVKWGCAQAAWAELKNEFAPALMCSFDGVTSSLPPNSIPLMRVVVPVTEHAQSLLHCVHKLLNFSPLEVELFIDKSTSTTNRLCVEAAKAKLKDHGHTVRSTHSSNALPFALEIRNFARFVDAHIILTCEEHQGLLHLQQFKETALKNMKSWLNLPLLVSPSLLQMA